MAELAWQKAWLPGPLCADVESKWVRKQLCAPVRRWREADINIDGSAPSCERKCSKLPSCIGYLTEDKSKCDIIKSTDSRAAGGIARVDSEKRNSCWQRVQETALDASSNCEAVASWPDGREEKRECHVLKM